jgi:hypothetical protein
MCTCLSDAAIASGPFLAVQNNTVTEWSTRIKFSSLNLHKRCDTPCAIAACEGKYKDALTVLCSGLCLVGLMDSAVYDGNILGIRMLHYQPAKCWIGRFALRSGLGSLTAIHKQRAVLEDGSCNQKISSVTAVDGLARTGGVVGNKVEFSASFLIGRKSVSDVFYCVADANARRISAYGAYVRADTCGNNNAESCALSVSAPRGFHSLLHGSLRVHVREDCIVILELLRHTKHVPE